MPNIQTVIDNSKKIQKLLNTYNCDKNPILFTTDGQPDVLGICVTYKHPNEEEKSYNISMLRKKLQDKLGIAVRIETTKLNSPFGNLYAKGPIGLEDSELAKEFEDIEFISPEETEDSPRRRFGR